MDRRHGVGVLECRRGNPRWDNDLVQRRNRRCWWTFQEAEYPSKVSITAVGADRGGAVILYLQKEATEPRRVVGTYQVWNSTTS